MPPWSPDYGAELRELFRRLTETLTTRLEQVAVARQAPGLDDMPIGSARQLSACILFFDIEGSSNRTPTGAAEHLKTTLVTLNCVIPMLSHVITGHGGYIEKNTGDGLMAVFGPTSSCADDSLDAATACFYVLREIVNPFLTVCDIAPVHARIGIDFGQVLVARIGVPNGRADNPRNFLTAIGPAANIAARLQAMAGTDGICVGHAVKARATGGRGSYFQPHSPDREWTWVFEGTTIPYPTWQYKAVMVDPHSFPR